MATTPYAPEPDLRPFGFTATESLVYAALLALGPTTGYAVAKALSLARANAYQALRGLAAKGAATAGAERPPRFRAVQPEALLALLERRQADRLEALAAQLSALPASGSPATTPITTLRALHQLALRLAAREPGALRCVAAPAVLGVLLPAWHRRAADGRPTDLWILGEEAAAQQLWLPLPPSGRVAPELARRYFADQLFLMAAADAACAATWRQQTVTGYWSSEPLLVALVQAAIALLTALTPSTANGGLTQRSSAQ